jgi:hypothetical protein
LEIQKERKRMSRGKVTIPTPLDLFFMLVDSCMHRLSPNAWKVVCYVAVQHLRTHGEWLEKNRDPALFALRQDLTAGAGFIEAPESTQYPYRSDDRAPAVPGEQRGRFAIIPATTFCQGVKINRRWRDYGTGLSKSSVAKAINEALQSGILVRERHKSAAGRDLPSFYAIDWDRVQEVDWERRKSLKSVSRRRTP